MITRQIRSRGVEAVILFMLADPDFFALLGGVGVEAEEGYVPPQLFRQPYDEMGGSVPMAPRPRQAHVYAGASVKVPGVSDAWERKFEVIVEWYGPRNEPPPALGDLSIDDEIDELANRLYVGQAPKSPGRFVDPDNPGTMITLGIESVRVSMPRIAEGEAGVRRDLNVLFFTRENAEGERV